MIYFLSFILLKSGGTPETRNGLLEVQKAFREAGLEFAKQVLISGSCFYFYSFYVLEHFSTSLAKSQN